MQRVKESRLFWPVVVALTLAAVPTAASLFSEEFALLPLRVRGAIGLVWLAVAVVAGWRSAIRDQVVSQLSGGAVERRLRRQQLALDFTIRGLVRDGEWSIPPCYEMTLYVYDASAQELVPMYPRLDRADDPRVFAVGRGATGAAWDERRTIWVAGEAVSNEKYGLSEEQRAFFGDYRVVIAEPIFGLGASIDDNPGAEPIGVLTLLSLQDDEHFTAEINNLSKVRSLADALGVILSVIAADADLVVAEV